ncbi:LAME_0H02080g1_1 [Lachancea meyersii CBS 8951]|uniref:LAME_0H02080g1_1 n=1 Tax=Lachancea meyersii CBS 8951 TaxID=1266667 RepID=A0A1G4KDI9_9SACH|nr:LAME_0H02080g1_1 [Lachancea meyersii CBS 8951]
MYPHIISNSQIRDLFLEASQGKLVDYITQLHKALQRYSKNPGIVPSRFVQPTPDGSTTHFNMQVLDDVYCGVKTLGYNPANGSGFEGVVIVTDPKSGRLKGVAEVKELTGVRTAMCSCIALLRQLPLFEESVKIAVFGTGLQAFWHAYICCKLLEGRKITVSFAYRCTPMDTTVLQQKIPDLNIIQMPLGDQIGISKLVCESNIIFGCIPSTVPGILKKHLDQQCGPSYTYISLIGSYKSHMHECDTLLVEEFKQQGAQILVDSIEHTLAEAGELIDAQVEAQQLLELGQLDRAASVVPAAHVGGHRKVTMCKIVGLAVMDVSVAQAVLVEMGQ